MNYIENLRYSRGISQEDFLHDVISSRQYQRYRNGESEVSMDCIERISSKFGVEVRKLLADYEKEKTQERELVEEFYNSVIYKSKESLRVVSVHLLHHNFLDQTNEEFYQLARSLMAYTLNNINKEHFLSQIYGLIQYPQVLNLDILRDTEIIGLLLIYQHNPATRKEIITLIKSLNDNQESFLSGQSYFVLVMFMYFIAMDYGKDKEYSKVEEYCFKGITLLKKKQSNYALYLIYYQLASSYYCRGMMDLFKDSLYKCIIYTRTQFSKDLTKQIYKKIKEYYNIDAQSFLVEYLNSELE
jgi:transcriptional regulator with XRE-family HTH domain